MAFQLHTDCLNEIFEHLEGYPTSLRSCLLVNRFWCKIAVRILWKNVWNVPNSMNYEYRKYVPLSILSTLIACLPNESKNLLYENGISILTPTSKSPLFNYISFIKALSFSNIEFVVDVTLNKKQINTPTNKHLVIQELLKAFMNQISSLKSLNYNLRYLTTINDIPFVSFPGAKDCLTDLLEFKCVSDYYPKYFHQLPQICHNIQSLSIILHDNNNVSNGLKELISSQNH